MGRVVDASEERLVLCRHSEVNGTMQVRNTSTGVKVANLRKSMEWDQGFFVRSLDFH